MNLSNLTHTLFEAAAWIAIARLNYIRKGFARSLQDIATGEYGNQEIDAFWAGLESQSRNAN